MNLTKNSKMRTRNCCSNLNSSFGLRNCWNLRMTNSSLNWNSMNFSNSTMTMTMNSMNFSNSTMTMNSMNFSNSTMTMNSGTNYLNWSCLKILKKRRTNLNCYSSLKSWMEYHTK